MNNPEACEIVTLLKVGSPDSYGVREVASTTETGWYFEPSNKVVVNSLGAEVVVNLFAMSPADSIAAEEDLVEWLGRKYKIVVVDSLRKRGQIHHHELHLRSVGVE